jgi:hypothetical protein
MFRSDLSPFHRADQLAGILGGIEDRNPRTVSYFYDLALLIDIDLANGAKGDIQAIPGVP